MKQFKIWLTDTIERVVATYLEVFIGFLIAGPHLDISTAEAAAWAAVPAALAVLKASLASLKGDASSASMVR